MGKAIIQSGGTAGLYQIRIKTFTAKAEQRIDALQKQVDKLESAIGVEFSPPLSTQASDLSDLIDAFGQGIEDNRDTEEDDRQLQKQLVFEKAQLTDLQADLSAAQSASDAALQDYESARDQFDAGAISQAELDWWESRYHASAADLAAKQTAVDSQQVVVDGIQAQLDSLTYVTLDSHLQQIKQSFASFLAWNEKEPIAQLESHLELAETLLAAMAGAFKSAIAWYNDAVSSNLDAQQEALELGFQQQPIQSTIDMLTPGVTTAKSNLDQATAAWEDAYVQYLRGAISAAELQPYTDAKANAATAYSDAAANLSYWQGQHDVLEIQQNQCVTIPTRPMLDRVNNTAAAMEEMQQDVGALRTFLHLQELKKASLEKAIAHLQEIIAGAETIVPAWCADLTEDLAPDAVVGTMEIMGEDKEILVRPGYADDAQYQQTRDGQLMPVGLATPAQAFYNAAMLPGWQKWRPTYRTGKLTAIDADTCNVTLDAAKSAAQGLNVNQAETLANVPIEYMSCHGAAFEVGDSVVVQFIGQDWQNPKVIGFKTNPKSCPGLLVITCGLDFGGAIGVIEVAMVWNPHSETMADIGMANPIRADAATFQAWLADHDEIALQDLWAAVECDPPSYDPPCSQLEWPAWCSGGSDEVTNSIAIESPGDVSGLYPSSADCHYQVEEADRCALMQTRDATDLFGIADTLNKSYVLAARNGSGALANLAVRRQRTVDATINTWDLHNEGSGCIRDNTNAFDKRDIQTTEVRKIYAPYGDELVSLDYSGRDYAYMYGEGLPGVEHDCTGYRLRQGTGGGDYRLFWKAAFGNDAIYQFFGAQIRKVDEKYTCGQDIYGRWHSEDGTCLVDIDYDPADYCWWENQKPPERYFVIEASCIKDSNAGKTDPTTLQHNTNLGIAIGTLLEAFYSESAKAGYDDSAKLVLGVNITAKMME